MRFPDIPLMARTFDLFRRLNFGSSTLIPYILSAPNDIQLFNGYLITGKPGVPDPFHVSVSNGGTVPDNYVQQGYDNLIEAKFSRFKEDLARNFDEGWKELIQYDGYSTRAYMSMNSPEYPDSVSAIEKDRVGCPFNSHTRSIGH